MSKLFIVIVFVGLVVVLLGHAYYLKRSPFEQVSTRMPAGPVAGQATTMECTPSRSLIGKWTELDTHPSHTLELNSDGTFADRQDGILNVFDGKVNMETGEANSHSYPASATTTGRWSIVVDPSKEPQTDDFGNAINIPRGGVVLREDVGGSSPWYFTVSLNRECTALKLGTDAGEIQKFNRSD